MRGIADTAYVLHEWGTSTFSLRKLIMFIACLEAHLIPVVTLTSLVILPVYYNIFMLLTTGAQRSTVFVRGVPVLVPCAPVERCIRWHSARRSSALEFAMDLPTWGRLASGGSSVQRSSSAQ